MNCPSRTDEPEGTGFNQNPNALGADLTTRQDLNGIANSRILRRIASSDVENVVEDEPDGSQQRDDEKGGGARGGKEGLRSSEGGEGGGRGGSVLWKWLMGLPHVLKTFASFVGPGFVVCPLIVPPYIGMF